MSSARLLLAATLGVASCTSLAGLRGGASGPVRLIDGLDGPLDSSAAAEVAAGASGSVALVASVGAQARGRRLLNDLFETNFETSSPEGGAWLAAASSSPSLLLLTTGGTEAELGSFSLALADAVLVHTPSTPSDTQLQASYERLFSQHLAVASADDEPRKVLLVHVGEGSEKSVRKACAQAWKVATAAQAGGTTSFEDSFELEVAPLPHPAHEAGEYLSALEALRARLRGLPGAGYGRELKPASFGGAAEAAWSAACAAIPAAEQSQCERYLTDGAYDKAFAASQAALASWTASVAAGKFVRGFGVKAAALVETALSSFQAGTADVSGSEALVAARSTKLRKAVQNDVTTLFAKQHKLLAAQQLARYKAQLLKVVSRSGKLEAWQREGLQRACEKGFDAGISGLYVEGLNGPSKQQLVDAFSKQLTAAATAFQESPAVQLQAIGAVRRRTGKQPKPPRGVRVGVGLTGACHSKLGGGQGNLQTFAGYTAGLNSAHFLFANDGALPDSSGSEPDLFRLQPKLNFDIAV